MNRMLALLVVAVMATMALAVPTPTKTISKRSFAAKVKGHGKLTPKEAMQRAARKYGFEVGVVQSDLEARHWDPEDRGDGFSANSGSDFSWPSSLPWPIPSESALVIWALPSSSALPSASASGFAIPSGFSAIPSGFSALPSGFSVVPSGSSLAPSSSFPSSLVASSSAPPVQSSAPPVQSSAPAPAPSASAAPGSGSATGVVTATPEQSGSFYLAPVTIGNQNLNLDFDTGSADLWVFSPQAANGHTAFNPSKSSTFTTYQGGSWMIRYGDGSTASGTVGFDQVSIGGAVVQKQCVELADQVSPTFAQEPATDGLLGLAFSTINTVQPQRQKTFFENIMNNLDQPLFTANLEEDNSGTYEFGKIDTTKFTGNLQYAPVDNSAGFWQIDSKSFAVGGTQQFCPSCNPFILDTGTTLLIMDDAIVKAYYSQVNGAKLDANAGGYVYPCSTTPPDFGVAIGNGMVTIKGADMTYIQAGGGLCFGGLQPGGTQAGVNILGDVLLKQFFAVFDGGNMQVGLAPKA